MQDTENDEKPPKKQETKNDKKPTKKDTKKKQPPKDTENDEKPPKRQKTHAKDTEKDEKPEDTENDTKPPQNDKKPKPIPDMDLGVVRVRYTTQGSKNPIVKLEVREDRFRPNEFLGAATPSGDPRRWWLYRATGLQHPQDLCSLLLPDES